MTQPLFPNKHKPVKAPNEIVDFDKLPFDLGLVSSPKKDGNRGLCINGRLYTSSMKVPRNDALYDMLAPLVEYSERQEYVFDYEVFDPEGTHHAVLSGIINSFDREIPPTAGCYVFDAMPFEEYHKQCREYPYAMRMHEYPKIIADFNNPRVIALPQRRVETPEEARKLYESDLAAGDEGSILRAMWISGDPDEPRTLRGGWYKHGRSTVKQGIMLKAKQYVTSDGQITEVIQRRRLKSGIAREYDQFGHLKKVYTKDSYELQACIGAFTVKEEDGTVSSISFGRGFPMADRSFMWSQYETNPERFIGAWIEFLHMPHGAQEAGSRRLGRFVRFRDSK